MSKFNLYGLGVALVTPFTNDKSIDVVALKAIINHIIKGGADYLVILGTTAETPTLSSEERMLIMNTAVDTVEERIPIVVGLGGNNTNSLINEIKNTNFSGISGILSVTPYYNRPSQEGLFEHFSLIAEASPLPVILYNIPSRTGVNLSAETTLRLAEKYENVCGLKDAAGDIKQSIEILQRKPTNFSLISGDDSMAVELIRHGASGVISVIGNALPNYFSSLINYALSSDYDKAETLDKKLKKFYHLLFKEGNPAGIKSLLHTMGLIEEELRLPLTKVSDKTSNELRKCFEDFKTENHGMGL